MTTSTTSKPIDNWTLVYNFYKKLDIDLFVYSFPFDMDFNTARNIVNNCNLSSFFPQLEDSLSTYFYRLPERNVFNTPSLQRKFMDLVVRLKKDGYLDDNYKIKTTENLCVNSPQW